MSEKMYPIPFASLMNWVVTEYAQSGDIFGVHKKYEATGKSLPIFGERIETPFGPAAGPNSQLAQNIIAAYFAGARFFELKTVQKMDGAELAACVPRPCILANDEGYNQEWSTELTVPQAMDEYIKAWCALKILAKIYGLGDPDGFVFNMSVGYDLEGIKGEKVDTYINNMKDASNTPVFQEAIAWAKANLDRFQHVDAAFVDSISPCVSRSVTESTLHGCPPAEIERIATHLITEKGLNTYIKCNPTLLGYEYARKTLDSLGFDYIVFDEHHFNEDLQWVDAVPMLNRLIALAKERGVEFGVKLTNTFPVDVTRSELPSDEMYMSGRSLYPLTVSLAKRIADEFDGSLRISFSGGADALNVRSLVDAGIWPVTVATTLLKPGGYQHLGQIDEALAGIDEKPFSGVDPAKVAAIVDDALTNPRYRKPVKPTPERHVGHELPLIDCFTAPCREDCPIEQDIPGYLRACEEGRYADALNIILERNALPFTTGTICPHTCGNSCMRNYYEEHVHIREFKLLAAENGLAEVLPTLSARGSVTGRKVAVVGAGPAGLAAASFLSRAGVDVTVFERTGQLGGIVRHVIPGFRISDEAIDHDVELCSAYGATFKTGVEVTNARDLLDQGFTDVVVAIGAWAPGRPALRSGEALDAIDFLREKYAPMPIVGMEPAVKPACLATRSGVVGVLATERSLDGELFRRTAARYGDGVDLVTAPGRGFVELVENDLEATPEAEATVRAAVAEMLEHGADQIVLGCTHYPFLLPVLERVVAGRGVTVVDPSPAVARRVVQLLDRYGLHVDPAHRAEYTFRTFADEAYRLRLERKALGAL